MTSIPVRRASLICVGGFVLLIAVGPIAADEPAPRRVSGCADTPAPDPAAALESFPEHVRLAELLRVDDHERLTCRSRRLEYLAARDGARALVRSTYRRSGELHAETSFQVPPARHLAAVKDGVLRAYRPDGTPLAVEYFCDGRAVGFHRYYDARGKLSHVADYTRSDYKYRKANDFRPLHSFYVENPLTGLTGLNRLGSVSGAFGHVMRFREVRAIAESGAARVSLFALAAVLEEQADSMDRRYRARALCEIGATYARVGNGVAADSAFERGLAIAWGPRRSPLLAHAWQLGACAHWLDIAGRRARADALMAELDAQARAWSGPESLQLKPPAMLINLAAAHAQR